MNPRCGTLLALTLMLGTACSHDNTPSTSNSIAIDPTPTATPTRLDGPPDAPNSPPFRLSSLDERCGDQTAKALLAHVGAEYRATIRKLHADIDLPAELPLTIYVAYRNGTLTCYPAQVPPPGSTRPIVFEQVGIVTHFEFVTEGGEFQEKFGTELKGRGAGSRGSMEFSHVFDADDLQGVYVPDLADHEGQFVAISGSLWDDASGGSISQGGQRPGHVSEIGFVASWLSND